MSGDSTPSSILNDVKQTLGLLPTDTAFDSDILMHINTVIAIISQIGVPVPIGFEVRDETTQWSDLFTNSLLNPIKSYMFLRVKLMFDPPASGFATDAVERQIQELEFRIHTEADY